MEKSVEYHRLDCVSLLEALNTFNTMLVDQFGVDITNAMTISGLVKKIYLKCYYGKQKSRIFNLTEAEDQFIRKSYRGGMS